MKRINLWLALFIVMLALAPVGSRAQAQSPCGNSYIVQPGDTLREIANRCGVPLQTLLDLNPFITNRNLLFPGWILDLPGSGQGQVIIPETGAAPSSSGLYVVKPGDSLSYISRRLDIDEDVLLDANPDLTEDSSLQTGQILRLSETLSNPAAAVAPRVVEPGQAVKVVAGGFQPNRLVLIAGGPLGTTGRVFAREQTDDQGWVDATVQIPVTANRGNQWVMLVRANNNPNVRAVSNLLYVVDTSGPQEAISYIVRTNDTLSAIAARFGITTQQLLNANPQISNPRVIYVGQEILIPGPLLRQQPPEGEAGLFLAPESGAPGSEVEVFVLGLPTNALVDLKVDDITDQQGSLFTRENLRASARGTLVTTITLPQNVSADAILNITADPENDQGITPPSRLFYVTQAGIPQTGSPSISISPTSGPPGSNVVINGSGFPANTFVSLEVQQLNQQADYSLQLRTDNQGRLQGVVTIPRNSASQNPYLIQLTPLTGGRQESYTAVFELTQQGTIPETGGGQDIAAALSLFPQAGPPGTIFTVVVTDYPANQPITLGIGRSQTQADLSFQYTTDAAGNFSARIQVPQGVNAGSFYTITISPRTANAAPSLTARFNVTNP